MRSPFAQGINTHDLRLVHLGADTIDHIHFSMSSNTRDHLSHSDRPLQSRAVSARHADILSRTIFTTYTLSGPRLFINYQLIDARFDKSDTKVLVEASQMKGVVVGHHIY